MGGELLNYLNGGFSDQRGSFGYALLIEPLYGTSQRCGSQLKPFVVDLELSDPSRKVFSFIAHFVQEPTLGFGSLNVVLDSQHGVVHRHRHPKPPLSTVLGRGGEGIFEANNGLPKVLAATLNSLEMIATYHALSVPFDSGPPCGD